MIYLLHGEDTASSRTKLLSIVDKNTEIIHLDAKRQSLTEILDAFAANSLFSSRRSVVVEYFSKVQPIGKLMDTVKKFEKDPNTYIILWDEVEIPAKILSSIISAQISLHVFPKLYYKFLDGLTPKNVNNSVQVLNELMRNFTSEQILYALIKRIRSLVIVKNGDERKLSETSKLADWQIDRLRRQANTWSEKQLTDLYIKLAETEEELKSSGLAMPLIAHLDTILLSDLN